eukprot:gnl/Ergobibamus_cyprinoides/696.p1 GENE.gnl/Ergobibamus_cyprinoides/696~~gnl/Ergobibamus_cyprinoides/696.p1  ORF type:complete len:211 (+),score=28.78 gnl/Ergobibamus_cyprinoides/696:72-704(+)
MVGNSLTFFNSMPRILSAVLREAFTVVPCCEGGKDLFWHVYDNPSVLAQLQSRPQFVVLQDHSLSPLRSPSAFQTAISHFCALVRSFGAEPVLYQTWGRPFDPQGHAAITAAYVQAAKANDCPCARVGEAFSAFAAENGHAVLFRKDNIHPTIVGSLLAAHVLARTLAGPGLSLTASGLAEWALEPGVSVTVEPDLAARVELAALSVAGL